MPAIQRDYIKAKMKRRHTDSQILKGQHIAPCRLLTLNSAKSSRKLDSKRMHWKSLAKPINELQSFRTLQVCFGTIGPVHQLGNRNYR